MNSHHEDRGWKVPVPTALANANCRPEKQYVEGHDEAVHVPDPSDVDPRDVQGVAETRKEHHAHAEQGNGPAAVAPDGKQRHPSHGKHDGAGRDHGKTARMKKADHEQHDHNGVQELDGGGDAARHVVQAVKKQQRGRRIHEAHARQLAQVDRAGVEAFPPQHEHAPGASTTR